MGADPVFRYVMIDDERRILAATKEVLRQRLVSVFARQGHHANDPLELDFAPWLGTRPAPSTTSQENP